MYPFLLIPPISEPLPKKKVDDAIVTRQGVIEKFLNKVLDSKELWASTLLFDFLTSQNQENLHKSL